jgi:aminocarboxymuconate-semialdehyde decarboxylase
VIVDTQSHWYPAALIEAYLGRDEFPRARRTEGSYAIERAPDFWFELPRSFLDLEVGLEAMEQAGVAATVSSSASYGDVDFLPVEQAREVAVAVNEARAEAERRYPGKFYGLATIPWQDGDAALEAIDDAVQRLGLRGVVMHSNVAGQPVEDEARRPAFRRLAELGVPLFLHPGRSVFEPDVRRYGMEYMVGFVFDTSVAALGLVLSGALDECPGLVVVLPHGGGTLPYLIGRIDALQGKPYIMGRELERAPSDYLRAFYTDSACFNAETLARAIEFFSLERMLFGSDYPFFPPEEPLAFVRRSCTEREQRLILAENPRRLLKLDRAAG